MIKTALNISLIILGIYVATRDGMIFERPRAWIQTKMDRIFGVAISELIQKPIFECLYCMASVWGIILSLYFGVNLYDIPAMILTVCGINTVLGAIVKYLEM